MAFIRKNDPKHAARFRADFAFIMQPVALTFGSDALEDVIDAREEEFRSWTAAELMGRVPEERTTEDALAAFAAQDPGTHTIAAMLEVLGVMLHDYPEAFTHHERLDPDVVDALFNQVVVEALLLKIDRRRFVSERGYRSSVVHSQVEAIKHAPYSLKNTTTVIVLAWAIGVGLQEADH